MNLDRYQQAWKADTDRMRVTIDTESLTKEVRRGQETFHSTIFWRDVREAGTSLIMVPIWLAMGVFMAVPWTWYLTIVALIWVAAFILIDRRRHPQRMSEPGETLVYYVKESLPQVEHQIWLLRNVFWWYLLPFCISIMAFFLHVSWGNSNDWWEFGLSAGFFGLLVFVVYWVTYRANQYVVREHFEPRRQDLLRLIANLEEDASDEDIGDIFELVAGVADPMPNCNANTNWGENWNQIIPTWWTAAVIIAPTLGGALCGLYSGLYLPQLELGPTLFQTVVGAVIPFEIALGWVLWKFWKKPSVATDMESNNSDAEDDPQLGASATRAMAIDDSTDKAPKALPRAPALVIIFLILFLSLMAIVAIISFRRQTRGHSSASQSTRLIPPDFADISAFGEGDIAVIDSWLEKQFAKAGYPSLTVAILRDGKIVYDKSLGYENVKEQTKATLQTQYHVASVSKAFTATLAVLLHEQGTIDLDQPVATYLPEDVTISTTSDIGATITLRQLARHTSGLPRGVPGFVQSIEGYYALEPQRLYQLLSKVKLEYEPDTAEEYSNLGFGLLGHTLETATGKSLDHLLQRFVCEPLALQQTSFQMDDSLRPATGYDEGGRNQERTHSFRRRLAGSGGLVTSVADLTKFLSSQMQPGVFSEEVLHELHSRPRLTPEFKPRTALGWSAGFSSFVGPILEKNGGRSNCSAWIGFASNRGVGVAVITNSGGPDVDKIGEWLLDRSAPGAFKLKTKYGYARVAPFTGVRWKKDRPIVRVNDTWSPLVSINDIPIDSIMEFADKEFGSIAQKRFAEDLVQVLLKMGHEPEWRVTLGLQMPNGKIQASEVLMTEEKRQQVFTGRLISKE